MTAAQATHVPLGRAGLRVSRLCLGTVNIGGRVDGREALALLDGALDAGIDFVDTADIYGWRIHQGHTEELLGAWLARPGVRDRVVLATKVGNRFGAGPNDEGLSARHIVRACEASLRRLRTDHVDLYQMHRPDPATSWEEIWEAMCLLVAQGKVRYVGSSNFAGWQLASAQEAARSRHAFGLASEQCLYNPLVRHAELEIIPAARHYGIGVLVWSPLYGGLLSGVLAKLADGTAVKSAQGRAAIALDGHRAVIERFEQLCAERGRPPAEVGMAWTLARPGVTAIVIGPRNPAHLKGALAALREPLDPDLGEALDELFPPIGQGGPGPGAWLT
ncbi:aldo/keto reductase [Amycolatopsis rhizosphaerae]|uniref:Aldo/keto reductase n=1 Tax=Amycolatopsis rhizosphaerae TaxID=2053003 RepID=A0A558DKC1_9PSEU|nr:aldo/keto reductase [Amycolatopsis rhizosphaerae]TVT61461.1 aldo/keto reductase [Amycolatopsis rhizosphaerae]